MPAREQVTGLTNTVADLRAERQDDRAELGRLRVSESALHDANATCQESRLTLTAQAQPVPELKAQLESATQQLEKLKKTDAAMAATLNRLLHEEDSLSEQIRNRTVMATFGSDDLNKDQSDPAIRHLMAQRQDLAEHINVLLGARPDLRAKAIDERPTTSLDGSENANPPSF